MRIALGHKMDFIFTRLSVKHLIYLTLTTCSAFAFYFIAQGEERYWLIWSCLLFSLIAVGKNFADRLCILVVAGIGFALEVLLFSLLVKSKWLAPTAIFLITFASLFLTERFWQYFYIFFLANLFAVLAVSIPTQLSGSLDRSLFVSIGILISLFFQAIFRWQFIDERVRHSIVDTLRYFKWLTNDVFACFLQPAYTENIYLFESRIHKQKIRSMKCLNQLNEATKAVKNRHDSTIKTRLFLEMFNRIFILIQDLSQLRRRVSDHTIFDVCRDELVHVNDDITRIFTKLAQQIHAQNDVLETSIDLLGQHIEQLEAVYTSALQVIAREPLVFLLFIASLKSLHKELLVFSQHMGSQKFRC